MLDSRDRRVLTGVNAARCGSSYGRRARLKRRCGTQSGARLPGRDRRPRPRRRRRGAAPARRLPPPACRRGGGVQRATRVDAARRPRRPERVLRRRPGSARRVPGRRCGGCAGRGARQRGRRQRRRVAGRPRLRADDARLACHRAVGRYRSRIVRSLLTRAVACQRGVDADRAARFARRRVCAAPWLSRHAAPRRPSPAPATASTAPPSAAVRRCPCAVDAAVAAGAALAAALYGRPAASPSPRSRSRPRRSRPLLRPALPDRPALARRRHPRPRRLPGRRQPLRRRRQVDRRAAARVPGRTGGVPPLRRPGRHPRPRRRNPRRPRRAAAADRRRSRIARPRPALPADRHDAYRRCLRPRRHPERRHPARLRPAPRAPLRLRRPPRGRRRRRCAARRARVLPPAARRRHAAGRPWRGGRAPCSRRCGRRSTSSASLRDAVAAATVFTVGDVVAEFAAQASATGGARSGEHRGRRPRRGAPALLRAAGARPHAAVSTRHAALQHARRLRLGDDGLPIVQREEDAPVVITVPRQPMPAGGYPLVLYFHGSGGLAAQVVDRGPCRGGGSRRRARARPSSTPRTASRPPPPPCRSTPSACPAPIRAPTST